MSSLKIAFVLVAVSLVACATPPNAEEMGSSEGAMIKSSEACSTSKADCLAYCDDTNREKCTAACALKEDQCNVVAPYVEKELARCGSYGRCNGDTVCNNAVTVCYRSSCQDGVEKCKAEHNADECTGASDWACD